MKATIWTYDVWGNDTDGYEVNDRSKYGVFELDYEGQLSTNAGILKFLQEKDVLANHVKLSDVDIDGDDINLYIEDSSNGMPLCGIEVDE